MTWTDYARHLAVTEAALDRLDPPRPDASRQTVTDYAVAHALVALAHALDHRPVLLGEGKIELREAPTRQT
jgi:hypothetical protein